ncbi:MAG TPA: hypothetical protein VF466_03595 [Candidatus Saccharimonadales bacterium]
MERVKANPVASVNRPPLEVSSDAAFVDGGAITGDVGGIVVDGGAYYSVARAEMVPNGQPTARTDNGYAIPANRSGRVNILEHTTSQPTTYGAELEAIHVDAEGNYADLPTHRLHQINELYTFMVESGTKPTDDPDVFRARYWEMVQDMVAEAATLGHYAVGVGVFGQPIRPEQLNSSPYVEHVASLMGDRTGFETIQMFRTAGAQPHTGVSNTRAALIAGEAMQYLNPIFMAPTMSGPNIAGGVAGDLSRAAFTDQQRAHMARMGVEPDDLSRPYLSWRYLLRVLGSPSSGIWTAPPAGTMEEYLGNAHQKLAAGAINTVDRANGWHTDRIRMVLDGSGANTLEGCADDPALANPDVNVPLTFLRSAVFTSLEAMAMRGADPRVAVAARLGTASLSRASRLRLAHDFSLRETSRYGTDANNYGRAPGKWLGLLLEIAKDAPHTRINDADQLRLRRAFATQEQARAEINNWCVDNGTNVPTPQAYFDLGLGSPAVYMSAMYRGLHEQEPQLSRVDRIRRVELAAGQALHNTVSRVEGKR